MCLGRVRLDPFSSLNCLWNVLQQRVSPSVPQQSALLPLQTVLCVLQVDCVSLCGDTSAATEEKIHMAFAQAQQYHPCVLLLKDIEVLGRDRDRLGEDARVIATLRQLLLDRDPAQR